jgi:hypothetical protein
MRLYNIFRKDDDTHANRVWAESEADALDKNAQEAGYDDYADQTHTAPLECMYAEIADMTQEIATYLDARQVLRDGLDPYEVAAGSEPRIDEDIGTISVEIRGSLTWDGTPHLIIL